MALIGSVVNQGSLQGEIASYNGALSGVFANTGLVGGQVVGMRGLQGEKGDTGATGNGIASVTYVSSSGLVDTYKITFTNGTETTFDVTNGEDGTDNYESLVNKPQIEGVTLIGNKSFSELSLNALTNIEIEEILEGSE